MAMLSAMVNTLACFYPRVQHSTEEEFDEEAAWLLSKARTIAAYSYRRSMGYAVHLSRPQAVLRGRLPAHDVLDAVRAVRRQPRRSSSALNLVLILHADHELGCSTTTVRIVGSSQANLFASCAAGICSLWGPVHGGATIAVVEMLEADPPRRADDRPGHRQAKDKTSGFRLKGFGHRIYKNFDPRALILKQAAEKLLRHRASATRCSTSPSELEERALEDPYFVDHRLFPNADFYNGIMMRAIGIPRNMFTVIFAIGRMPGWIAHWKEQNDDPDGRIARPRQVYIGPQETAYVPIEER